MLLTKLNALKNMFISNLTTVGLIVLMCGMVYSCEEKNDLQDQVDDLEGKIYEIKKNVFQIKTEYINVEYNLARLSYDDWKDVLDDTRANFQNVAREVDNIEDNLN